MGPSTDEISEQMPWERRDEESPGNENRLASPGLFGVYKQELRDSWNTSDLPWGMGHPFPGLTEPRRRACWESGPTMPASMGVPALKQSRNKQIHSQENTLLIFQIPGDHPGGCFSTATRKKELKKWKRALFLLLPFLSKFNLSSSCKKSKLLQTYCWHIKRFIYSLARFQGDERHNHSELTPSMSYEPFLKGRK